MTPSEFEQFLSLLSEDGYDDLIQNRITLLNPEQQKIAQARELQRKERHKLISKLSSPDATEDDHHMVFNALRDVSYSDDCEHGRSYCKHCIACGEIDHIMFPELFNKEGFRIEEEEQEEQRPETD
jgi:hypothetical protein